MGVSKRKTPRKRKTRGKKRRKQKGGAAKLAQILKASAKRQAKRARRGARSAARYARRNKGRIAAGLAAAGALGLGGLEGMRARQRYLMDREGKRMAMNPYTSREDYTDFQARRAALESPTGRFFRGVGNYPYKDIPMNVYRGAMRGARKVNSGARRGARKVRRAGSKFLERLSPERKKRREMKEMLYGKRRRRKRKSSFGKKAKKPSAALKKLCKKHKVRLTVKRGKKRVYKSEKMLKKQCKTAMKRKKKKTVKRKSRYGHAFGRKKSKKLTAFQKFSKWCNDNEVACTAAMTPLAVGVPMGMSHVYNKYYVEPYNARIRADDFKRLQRNTHNYIPGMNNN